MSTLWRTRLQERAILWRILDLQYTEGGTQPKSLVIGRVLPLRRSASVEVTHGGRGARAVNQHREQNGERYRGP